MLKSILSGVIGSIITILVQIFSVFFITHLVFEHLKPTYASAWFLFYSIAQLLYVFDFGLSATLAREIAFTHRKEGIDFKRLHSVLRVSIGLNFIFGLIFLLLLLVMGEFYLSTIFHSLDTVIIQQSFIYFLGGAFFLFLNLPLLAIHYGFGHVFTERFLRAIILVVSVIALFIFFKWSNNFIWMCIIWLLVNALAHIFLRIYTCLKFNVSFFNLSINKAIAKDILSNSSQQGLIVLGAWIIFQIGYFIIAHKLGAVYVSQYAPLMQLATGLMLLASFLQYSSSPFISRLYIQGEHERVVYFLLKFNKCVLLITIAAAFFLVFNAPFIFEYWLGSTFKYSSWTFIILLIMVVLEVNHVSLASGAISCGYLRFTKLAWSAAFFSCLFGLILAKSLGLVGIALGLCLAQLITNNWGAVFLSLRFFHIPVKVYLRKMIFIPIYVISLYGIIKIIEMFVIRQPYEFLLSGFTFSMYIIALMCILFKKDISVIWSILRAKSATI